MAFHLFMSNSLEKLAALFRENLSPAAGDVFTPVRAVVANNGMAFFLKRTLARKDHLGIAANIECSFLQEFISEQIKNSLPEKEAEQYAESVTKWSPPVLSWRIDALFAREPERFPVWRKYWQNSENDAPDVERRHILSCELAGVFDRYQLYRREKLALWRQGKEPDSPQAGLFRALCEEFPAPERFLADFLASSPENRGGKIPARIGVFGIGVMPEFYLQCLKKLGEVSELFLFSPSPCRIYWGDFKSRRQAVKEADTLEQLEEIARNNPVLSDLGSAGRKFLERLLENDCLEGDPGEEAYVLPGRGENMTVLERFQADILDGRSRSGDEKITADDGDRSIRINNAPSARRELEALHDQLAELFYAAGKNGRELRPEDVIVMFPDIDRAAPLIESVFANGPFDGRFAICDRSTAGQSPLIECFGKLLALPRSRCTSREILDFLDFPCIHRKLGIDSGALPALTRLAARARICWGLSGEEREKFRETEYEEFSWQDGIDRLLTEFARGVTVDELFPGNGTGGLDNDAAENFGKLAEFVSLLRRWKQDLPRPRTAGEWKDFLCSWADRFFDASDRELLPELLELRRAAGAAADSAEKAAFTEKIAPEVFFARFSAEAAAPGGRQTFLRDKITFCSLVPLRAIPARVIAVLSLNEQEFPASDRHQDFDLLSQALRGDPNRADDSKYLLLEALMAAKEHLILSYVGRNDGKDMEPAVPLGVCLKALDEGFGIRPEKIRLPSVESSALLSQRNDPLVFKPSAPPRESPPAPPEAPEAPPPSMDLPKFCSHLLDSCGAFFELHRDFPFNPRPEAAPKVDDPGAPDPLDRSVIGKSLWKMRLEGVPAKERYERFKDTRLLPVCCGENVLDELNRIIDAVGEEELRIARESTPRFFEFPSADRFGLCGRISVLESENGISHQEFQFSKAGTGKKLRFYVERLLIAACSGKAVSGCQHFLFDEKDPVFVPAVPADARERLEALRGIVLDNCTGSSPLPLFLNASVAFAAGKDVFDVRKKFRDDCVSYDGLPTAVSFFYTEDVLDSKEFQTLADRVFGELVVLEEPRS